MDVVMDGLSWQLLGVNHLVVDAQWHLEQHRLLGAEDPVHQQQLD
jgi:hypothetical protein